MANRNDTDLAPAGAGELYLPLTAEGLALEVGSALDPSPPFLALQVARFVARLRARHPPRQAAA